MMTDAELLQRYATEGSEAAFAELVQRHLTLVYSTALRRLGGDAHLTQDVAQTVFTALARKATSLANHQSLAGWLYLGTQHAAAQVVRSAQRRRTREQKAQAMEEIFSSDAHASTDWNQVRPVLDDAMGELGDIDREAVLLRYFEQRPFAQVGAALKLTEDAARRRVDRALDKLRALLAQRGITSTTAALAAGLGFQTAAGAVPAGLALTITGTALASSTTATAGALVTFFLMNKSLVVTAAIALVATGLSFYQANQRHRAETAFADLVREYDGVHAQLREAQERTAELGQRHTSLQRELNGLFSVNVTAPPAAQVNFTAAKVSPTPESTLTGFQIGGVSGTSQIVPSDPVARKALFDDYFDVTYMALFRQLGWSAAQREQFKVLLFERKELSNRLFHGAVEKGVQPDRTLAQVVSDQTNAELKDKLRGVFGAPPCNSSSVSKQRARCVK